MRGKPCRPGFHRSHIIYAAAYTDFSFLQKKRATFSSDSFFVQYPCGRELQPRREAAKDAFASFQYPCGRELQPRREAAKDAFASFQYPCGRELQRCRDQADGVRADVSIPVWARVATLVRSRKQQWQLCFNTRVGASCNRAMLWMWIIIS